MKKSTKEIETLATSLKDQHQDMRVDNSYDLLRAAAILNKYLLAGYKKIKLKQNQVILLCFLLTNGGTITPTELKQKVFRTDNAISHSLDHLDKLGFTRSSGSKEDRRHRKVTLTEKGLEAIKQILPVRLALFTKATSCLNEEETRTLQSILEKLENHLLKITTKKPRQKKLKVVF